MSYETRMLTLQICCLVTVIYTSSAWPGNTVSYLTYPIVYFYDTTHTLDRIIRDNDLPNLRQQSSNMHEPDPAGNNPLHYAAFYNKAEITRWLMNIDPENASSKNQAGKTPIDIAAEHGHEHLKHILQAPYAIVPLSQTRTKTTPYSIAFYMQKITTHLRNEARLWKHVPAGDARGVTTATAIHQKPCYLLRQRRDKETLAHKAASNNKAHIVKALLALDVTCATVNSHGNSPQDTAYRYENNHIAKLFKDEDEDEAYIQEIVSLIDAYLQHIHAN